MPFDPHESEIHNAMGSGTDSAKHGKGKAKGQQFSYGATGSTPVNSQNAPSDRNSTGESLGRVPEDEGPLEFGPLADEAVDGGEEGDGDYTRLSRSRYKRAVRLFALVPFSSFLVFAILLFLPAMLWPLSRQDEPTKLRLLSALILSSALWSLSHVLRIPIHGLCASLTPDALQLYSSCLSTGIFVVFQEFLRLFAFLILNIRHHRVSSSPGSPPTYVFPDASFVEVWFIALGWALAEVIAGITQGYEQLYLYEDVTMPDPDDEEIPPVFVDETCTPLLSRRHSPEAFIKRDPGVLGPEPDVTQIVEDRLMHEFAGAESISGDGVDANEELDEELARLVDMRARVELEEVYGMPFVDIPVFISILQRIDSILLSLGLTLLLAAAYVQSVKTISPLFSQSSTAQLHPATLLTRTFVLVCVVHTLLSLLHTPPILPRIGIHTAAYVGSLVGLGTLFAGLGVWGALAD